MEKSDQGKFAILRKIRGRIVKRPRQKPIEVVANGRADWIGWVELKTAPVNERAVLNTGRVIKDVDADVLAVIEAEDRVSLEKFSDIIIKKVNGKPYDQVMLIDGNDRRGIDVGVMTKKPYPIQSIKSHIYDKASDGKTIFSRDCPEYGITTPSGETIVVIPNHFKSKYGGNNAQSRNKRLSQSKRTKEIYEELIAKGYENVIVLGDLNDTPDSNELEPLLQNTDLKDVGEHPTFDTGEFEGVGTYALGNDSKKIDYLLLSPNLFSKVTSCGLFRKGAWAGKRRKKWTTYENITKPIHVASDHHVIWAEINI
ncbi:endonuclease/exonuclease/phosphatase family protein [Aquimarina algiphila]|nr:endonuclease/exonuclease/phosphatase family protein [Aquimarina algiphila]